MKLLSVIFFILFIRTLSGQTGFAIINDKDGFCNVRSTAAKGYNVMDTLHNGHLVYCFEEKGNCTNVSYGKKKDDLLNGQIYSDRLKYISDYKEFSGVAKVTNQITLSKDSMKVVVTQQKFNKARYKLSYHKEDRTSIELINGKQYWGRDGGTPTSEYKSIEVYFGKSKMILPPKAFENLFEPSLYNTQVHFDSLNDVLYIESSNSDGAGAYEVIWKIEKGVYRDRYIAYGF